MHAVHGGMVHASVKKTDFRRCAKHIHTAMQLWLSLSVLKNIKTLKIQHINVSKAYIVLMR